MTWMEEGGSANVWKHAGDGQPASHGFSKYEILWKDDARILRLVATLFLAYHERRAPFNFSTQITDGNEDDALARYTRAAHVLVLYTS